MVADRLSLEHCHKGAEWNIWSDFPNELVDPTWRGPDAANEGPGFASNLLRGDCNRFKREYSISQLTSDFFILLFCLFFF